MLLAGTRVSLAENSSAGGRKLAILIVEHDEQ
jgi:hypothetical protein